MFANRSSKQFWSEYDNRVAVIAVIVGAAAPLNALFWIFFPGNLFLCVSVWMLVLIGFLAILRTGKQLLVPACFFILVTTLASQTVVIDWDARAIWLFHAKFIFFENSYYGSLDPYDGAHPTYPVIYPAMVAAGAKLVGYWNDVYPNLAVLPFIITPTLLLCLHFRHPLTQALMCTVIILTCKINLFNGYMDGLVALQITSILFLYLKYNDDKYNQLCASERNLVTALFFILAINLLNLKNEGLAAAGVVIVLTLIQKPSTLKTSMLTALITSVITYFLMWKIPVAREGYVTDLFQGSFFSQFQERLQADSVTHIFSHLMHDIWRWLLLFFIITLISRSHQIAPSRYRFLLQFCGIYFAIMFCIYMGTPADLLWHLKTSAGRVSTPIAMTIAFCITHWFCSNPYMRDLSLKIK